MGPNNLRVPKLDAVSILHKLGSRSRFRLPRNENTVQSLDYIEYKTETTGVLLLLLLLLLGFIFKEMLEAMGSKNLGQHMDCVSAQD